MSLPFKTLGAIALFAGKQTSAPKYWEYCNGQKIAISANTGLFSILGPRFGGDGKTNFQLPDLPDMDKCRHIIRFNGLYERSGEELPFVAPSTEYEDMMIGLITKTDGDVPNGWLPCDGRKLRKDDYQYLHNVIGTTWGADPVYFTIPKIEDEEGGKYIICTHGMSPN